MKGISFFVIVGLLLCLTSLKSSQAFQESNRTESAKLQKLFEDYFEERLRLFPSEAMALADSRYNDQLPDYFSEERNVQLREFYTRYERTLKQVNRQQLTAQDRLSYDVFKNLMARKLASLLKLHQEIAIGVANRLMPINQLSSLHMSFAQSVNEGGNQPFKTVKDYENFLRRVDGFEVICNTIIKNMRQGMAQGVVQPKILMERVLPQLQAFLVKEAKDSVFYQPIKRLPADFSAEEKSRLTSAYTKAINEKLTPAYQRLYDFIKNEYLPKCRTTDGLSALPQGKEQYAHLVMHWTTTNFSPDEIHQIGLAEVRRIQAEMEKVKGQVGFKGNLSSLFEYLRTDKQFFPFKTEQEVLDAFRAMESGLQANLPKYFGATPKAKFVIRPYPSFRTVTAGASYSRAAPDGSRPGIFYVAIPDATKFTNIGAEALFLHEAIPGHHYQIELQQETKTLPRFRQSDSYGAYTEGWGLYAESLGKELGIYTDPYKYYGMLRADIIRAIRLVLDTGIHAKGWTREQAIKYYVENGGGDDRLATAEVERYMASPGQALAYKIGQLKISELRRNAERTLGAKFSLRAFHDEILKDGALPLDILETKMNEWVRKQK